MRFSSRLSATVVPWTSPSFPSTRHAPVGVRHYPRDRALRSLVPAGIELAPPRREVSTGPGRHDFEIVVDPSAPVEEDLGRRDFTMNAMALIAPGAFLWLTFAGQAAAGATAPSMWMGIVFATLLCLATTTKMLSVQATICVSSHCCASLVV